jgi:hypothetical protein
MAKGARKRQEIMADTTNSLKLAVNFMGYLPYR